VPYDAIVSHDAIMSHDVIVPYNVIVPHNVVSYDVVMSYRWRRIEDSGITYRAETRAGNRRYGTSK
jgi:hypothetical protein